MKGTHHDKTHYDGAPCHVGVQVQVTLRPSIQCGQKRRQHLHHGITHVLTTLHANNNDQGSACGTGPSVTSFCSSTWALRAALLRPAKVSEECFPLPRGINSNLVSDASICRGIALWPTPLFLHASFQLNSILPCKSCPEGCPNQRNKHG